MIYLEIDSTYSARGHFFSSYHQNTGTFKVVELHITITCQLTRSVTIFVYAGKIM